MPRLVVRPLERFLALESGSAALLMAAAVVALIWVNVHQASYEDLWTTSLRLDVGGFTLDGDLRLLVNDLLMALFFYVVALEVKREALLGSLRDPRSAAVPVVAALGTMVGAALAYIAVNLDSGALHGWAIPIATDIAFALGALGLAGRRAPPALRTFLLTLAIVDDIGTIVVIALFYSSGVGLGWLAAGAGLLALVYACRRIGVRSMAVYVPLAALVWVAALRSGLHPTLAGVALGFLTPAVSLHARERTAGVLGRRLAEPARAPEADADADGGEDSGEAAMLDIAATAREAVSPLTRMETLLHPWTAYAILPIFALANAGVPISLDGLGDALTGSVGIGILLGLVVAAPLGGVLFSWLAVRFGPARMPDGLDWPAISALAPLKGIGFTIAIFISVLAFDDRAHQDQAKLAVLVASAVAALIGLAALNLRHRLVRTG